MELVLNCAHLVNVNHRFERELSLLPVLLAAFLFDDGFQVDELLFLCFDLARRAANGFRNFSPVRLVALLLSNLLNR